MGGGRSRAFHREGAGAAGGVHYARRVSGQADLYRARHRRHAARGHRLAGSISVYPRTLSHDVPRTHLDHAPDRRLRHRRRHECPLQVPDRQRSDWPVDRLRHADADGLRQRPSNVRRRGRARRSRDRHARRHGAVVRRHRSHEDFRIDDHQPERVDPACDVRRAREAARLRPQRVVRNDSGRHPEGIPGAEGMDLSDRAVGAYRPRLHHVLRAAT